MKSPRMEVTESPVSGDDLRRLLIELLKPLPAEVDVKDFIPGLGSFRMAPRTGALALARSQRGGAAQGLAHQGKRSTGDEGKTDQIHRSQKVVQGWKILSITLA